MTTTGPDPTSHADEADALAWALLSELVGYAPTPWTEPPPPVSRGPADGKGLDRHKGDTE